MSVPEVCIACSCQTSQPRGARHAAGGVSVSLKLGFRIPSSSRLRAAVDFSFSLLYFVFYCTGPLQNVLAIHHFLLACLPLSSTHLDCNAVYRSSLPVSFRCLMIGPPFLIRKGSQVELYLYLTLARPCPENSWGKDTRSTQRPIF